jgi:NADPH:quinone reductase-like Zn-dependent oxidoreductase
MDFLKGKTILITGGTGSFGKAAVKFLLAKCKLKKLIIFSRDENKQFEMQKKFNYMQIDFFGFCPSVNFTNGTTILINKSKKFFNRNKKISFIGATYIRQ